MKVNKKTIFEVNYNDLDKAVTEFLKSKGINCGKYGYECMDKNEWGNDESHGFNVKKQKLDSYDESGLTENRIPGLYGILNWMCLEGMIEEGEYLVDVCW